MALAGTDQAKGRDKKGELQMAKNAITWFSIPTADFDRAVKFYSTILGEAVQVHEFMGRKLGFFPMDGESSVGGDLVPPARE